MPIDQSRLNECTDRAVRAFCELLPTMTAEVTTKVFELAIEITVANPWKPERTIWVSTQALELTVGFAQSHFHISDYGQGRDEAELIEDMVLGIAGIIGGTSRAYSAFCGDREVGGGFIEGSSEIDLEKGWWDGVDRFEIVSWDGSEDKTVLKKA